jgi:hypothetical protein
MLAIFAGALETGCDYQPVCSARGSVTPLAGIATYAFPGAQGVSMSQQITVLDFGECTYSGEEFSVTVGECELWVSLEQGPEPASRYFPGNLSAWASVEPGQSCVLPLVNGSVSMTVETGTIAFASQTTVLFLTGEVSNWTSGTGATGPINWQFQGGGWPQ